MASKKQAQPAESAALAPTVVTEDTLGDALFDGNRRRPVVAINDEGQLVVCCRRTARKNGWALQKLEREPSAKPAKKGGKRRATDVGPDHPAAEVAEAVVTNLTAATEAAKTLARKVGSKRAGKTTLNPEVLKALL